jgi:hypothetical protein
MDEINSLEDVRPGDILFGPIGGLVGVGVGLGQLALREAFRIGRLSVRHVGIVVEGSVHHEGPMVRNRETGDYRSGAHLLDGEGLEQVAPVPEPWDFYPNGVITAPKLVQAMPHGAEEIEMRQQTHWTPRHVFMRLSEDYPGQAEDAAAIARLMVREGVAYSFASYGALAAWRWGIQTPRLEAWIGRRREAVTAELQGRIDPFVQLPVEAICSVLVDQAWSLAGKRVMVGTKPQVVTPGAMAIQLWNRPGVVRGGAGLL